MAFNLNISRKPERKLDGHLIDEMISIYGVPCKWLYSDRVNEDHLVFKDFSHFKVGKDYKEVYLLPENMENFDGEMSFNSFGLYQQYTIELFISAKQMLELYPDYLSERGARSKVTNSLILTPGGQILEVTFVESFDLGVSNQFTYHDYPNSYKLSCRVYSPNLSDEGVSDIDTTIKLEEGPDGSKGDGKIFEYDENVDTKEIEQFFNELESVKNDQNKESKKAKAGGPFGNLG